MKSKALKLIMVAQLMYTALLPISSVGSVLMGYALLVLSALLPVELLLCASNKLNRRQCFIVLSFFVVAVANSLISLFSIGFEEYEEIFKAFISFFAFVLAISVDEIKYKRKDLDFIFLINRLTSLVYILYTLLPFGFRYTVANKYGYMQFTLSMGNPNGTATKVLFCVMLLAIQFAICRSRKVRFINGIMIAGLLYTLFMLESRTALICAIIGIVMMLFKYKISSRVVKLAWIAPMVFIPIQLMLENVAFFKLLGKSLATGRQDMFTDFIRQIIESPQTYVLGNFAVNRLQNYHNIFFSILFNFGVVGVVLYFMFWREEIKKIRDVNSKVSNCAWIVIFLFIVQSVAESASMSGAFIYGTSIIILSRLAKDRMVDDSCTGEVLDEQTAVA